MNMKPRKPLPKAQVQVNLKDAETIFKLYEMETQNLISNIK